MNASMASNVSQFPSTRTDTIQSALITITEAMASLEMVDEVEFKAMTSEMGVRIYTVRKTPSLVRTTFYTLFGENSSEVINTAPVGDTVATQAEPAPENEEPQPVWDFEAAKARQWELNHPYGEDDAELMGALLA